MDVERERGREGRKTYHRKTNYRTEGPWAKKHTHSHTHAQPLSPFLSPAQTDTHSATLMTHMH